MLKAVPGAIRAARTARRAVLLAPPVVFVVSAGVGASASIVGYRLDRWLGVIPGVLVALAGLAGLACWLWTTRPARVADRFVVFVSEFAERSTHAQVRAAAVHHRELLDKFRAQPLLSERLEVRSLPPISLKSAERVLRRSPAWVVVLGETVTAGQHLKWNASMVFRLLAHSRYAGAGPDRGPVISMGRLGWTPLARLRLPADARQPIDVLTEADFPVAHAESIATMLLALNAITSETVEQLKASNEAVRARWDSAPLAAKALTIAAQADIAMAENGWRACRRVLRDGAREVQHPILQRIYAGYLALACAHGEGSPAEWLEVSEPIPAMTDHDPNPMFLVACALLANGRWADGLLVLRGLRGTKFSGPLSPDAREVLSAYVQAADLADEPADLEIGLRLLRKACPRVRLRRPPRRWMYLLAWMQIHNYDGVALHRIQARLDELGRDIDLAELRPNV